MHRRYRKGVSTVVGAVILLTMMIMFTAFYIIMLQKFSEVASYVMNSVISAEESRKSLEVVNAFWDYNKSHINIYVENGAARTIVVIAIAIVFQDGRYLTISRINTTITAGLVKILYMDGSIRKSNLLLPLALPPASQTTISMKISTVVEPKTISIVVEASPIKTIIAAARKTEKNEAIKSVIFSEFSDLNMFNISTWTGMVVIPRTKQSISLRYTYPQLIEGRGTEQQNLCSMNRIRRTAILYTDFEILPSNWVTSRGTSWSFVKGYKGKGLSITDNRAGIGMASQHYWSNDVSSYRNLSITVKVNSSLTRWSGIALIDNTLSRMYTIEIDSNGGLLQIWSFNVDNTAGNPHREQGGNNRWHRILETTIPRYTRNAWYILVVSYRVFTNYIEITAHVYDINGRSIASLTTQRPSSVAFTPTYIGLNVDGDGSAIFDDFVIAVPSIISLVDSTSSINPKSFTLNSVRTSVLSGCIKLDVLEGSISINSTRISRGSTILMCINNDSLLNLWIGSDGWTTAWDVDVSILYVNNSIVLRNSKTSFSGIRVSLSSVVSNLSVKLLDSSTRWTQFTWDGQTLASGFDVISVVVSKIIPTTSKSLNMNIHSYGSYVDASAFLYRIERQDNLNLTHIAIHSMPKNHNATIYDVYGLKINSAVATINTTMINVITDVVVGNGSNSKIVVYYPNRSTWIIHLVSMNDAIVGGDVYNITCISQRYVVSITDVHRILKPVEIFSANLSFTTKYLFNIEPIFYTLMFNNVLLCNNCGLVEGIQLHVLNTNLVQEVNNITLILESRSRFVVQILNLSIKTYGYFENDKTYSLLIGASKSIMFYNLTELTSRKKAVVITSDLNEIPVKTHTIFNGATAIVYDETTYRLYLVNLSGIYVWKPNTWNLVTTSCRSSGPSARIEIVKDVLIVLPGKNSNTICVYNRTTHTSRTITLSNYIFTQYTASATYNMSVYFTAVDRNSVTWLLKYDVDKNIVSTVKIIAMDNVLGLAIDENRGKIYVVIENVWRNALNNRQSFSHSSANNPYMPIYIHNIFTNQTLNIFVNISISSDMFMGCCDRIEFHDNYLIIVGRNSVLLIDIQKLEFRKKIIVLPS